MSIVCEELNDIHFKRYQNSTPVCYFNGEDCTVEDITKACLVSGLSLFLAGEKGNGKTLIFEEVNNWFGGKGIYVRASPDMSVKDLFQKFNLKSGSLELTDNIKAKLSIVDEANRAPPVVQNQIMNLTDGYIEFNANKIKLGDGYHVCIAAMNQGNGEYSGTFKTDTALHDRFITINLDNFFPKKDILNILYNNNTTKATVNENVDYSDLFIKLSNEANIKKLFDNIDLSFWIGEAVLTAGLDDCTKKGSKRAYRSAIPVICDGCHELGNLCGLIKPLSIRKTIALKLLYYGLSVVTQSKGAETTSGNVLDNILQCFKLIGPYAEVIDESLVRKEGNPYAVMDTINSMIRNKVNQEEESIKAWAIAKKENKVVDVKFSGLLSFLNDFEV